MIINSHLITQILSLIFFSFILVKATDITISALNKISRLLRVGAFGLAAFLLALATSLPELFVCLVSALSGNQKISLGVILGSNISNISLVIGGAALIGGGIAIVGDFLRRDIFYAFLAAILPVVLLLDNTLSRLDGLTLFIAYVGFNYLVFHGKPHLEQMAKEGNLVRRFFRRLNFKATEKQIGWLFIGIALLLLAADMVVKSADYLAQHLRLNPLFVGLVFVAMGTTLPELSLEAAAIRKKQVSMVFGNLLGSLVVNSTLILGLTAMIQPVTLDGGLRSYLSGIAIFIFIFGLFWFFVRSKRRLERWEAGILVLAYLLFVLIEFWQNLGF
ncbi:hypothetical protein A2160_04355 [Candidatus Beckwithbacteria bacterium RBG_13_42_9]|uniref:Sodium/calcium exchanger membrane region domain-containing protein n=1 Tax=Candidatus Beckwithbacteria bacterium RBG_13_42_9 TaxID=1797457 RepID=A0A1F5E6I1_9BACT|nr:MAG: hypothetical protein A2160_04355 [Candidatus Beckwithbacteria bacterium RBG_13_42_9]